MSRVFGYLRHMLPTLPKPHTAAEIPVYMVHETAEADDYFFLFDFRRFAEASKSAMFERPVLKVWAGRTDFGRAEFVRKLRLSFRRELERMRETVGAVPRAGWFRWYVGEAAIEAGVWSFVSWTVLMIFAPARKALRGLFLALDRVLVRLNVVKPVGTFAGMNSGEYAAFAELHLAVHQELCEWAYALGAPINRRELEPEAWPLPDYVRAHLNDKRSTSWW